MLLLNEIVEAYLDKFSKKRIMIFANSVGNNFYSVPSISLLISYFAPPNYLLG